MSRRVSVTCPRSTGLQLVAVGDAKMTAAEVLGSRLRKAYAPADLAMLVDVRDALAWHRGQLPRALVADLPRHRAAVAALEGLVEQLGAPTVAEASP